MRKAAEVPRRRGKGALDLAPRTVEQLVHGLGDRGRGGSKGRSRGGSVVAETQATGNLAALRLDRGQLLQPDPVQLARVDVQRSPGPDLGAVEAVAVGRGAQPRLLARSLAVFAQKRLHEQLIGRPNVLSDCLHEPIAVGRRREREGLDDRRLVVRNCQQPFQLADYPVRDDLRGGQAGSQSLADEFGVGGHETRIVGQPGQEGVELFGRLGRLERGQHGHECLRPVHLVDDLEPIDALVLLLQFYPADDPQNVEGYPFFRRQTRRLGRLRFDRVGLRESLAEKRSRSLPPFGSRIVQPVASLLVAEHRRVDRREVQEPLPETIRQRIHRVGRPSTRAHGIHVAHGSLLRLSGPGLEAVARDACCLIGYCRSPGIRTAAAAFRRNSPRRRDQGTAPGLRGSPPRAPQTRPDGST